MTTDCNTCSTKTEVPRTPSFSYMELLCLSALSSADRDLIQIITPSVTLDSSI